REILSVSRRGKHLILSLDNNISTIIHLGMSGSLQVNDSDQYYHQKHDHIVLKLDNNTTLFYNDPRRFGYWIMTDNNPLEHPCFKNYGPEPLSSDFNSNYLQQKLAHKKQSIKTAIMSNQIVVGVGNIYACESLFLAKIHPNKKANCLTLNDYNALVCKIKKTLKKAIAEGGTTLKDYKNAEGKPGYFSQSLHVYGRKNKPCKICNTPITAEVIAQRNTFFCQTCQSLKLQSDSK
ncbi:bifunctional DNA-formamidopyrimidine glycosylase/DNA-(apurinic or apyrimidinic site) lyase, partial [Fangia hongkongensis]